MFLFQACAHVLASLCHSSVCYPMCLELNQMEDWGLSQNYFLYLVRRPIGCLHSSDDTKEERNELVLSWVGTKNVMLTPKNVATSLTN